MAWLELVAGGALLYFGAEWLVSGASRLALSFNVPKLIVGLTVVAYGTSAPEVVVGVQAAHGGHGAVALGNVIGSNIANLGLILGLSVLTRPCLVDGALRRLELPVLLASTLALPLVMWDGVVTRSEGALLVGSAVAYTAWTVRAARRRRIVVEAETAALVTAAAAHASGAPGPASVSRQILIALLGLVAVLSGGQLFVSGATELARAWGMSERVVGLTLVALGTSMPELATGVIAALRGHADIAVGNVVGSNIFNSLLCLGSAGLVGSIRGTPRAFGLELSVLVAMTLLALVFLRGARTFQRWEGGLLLLGYAGFVLALLGR